MWAHLWTIDDVCLRGEKQIDIQDRNVYHAFRIIVIEELSVHVVNILN
jgi:hypothetical protein